DAVPPGRHGHRLGTAIQQPKIGEAPSAVSAGALEGERVRIAALPASSDEYGILPRQFVINAKVGAIAIAIQRQNLTIRPEPAIGSIRLIRRGIEIVDDAHR